MIQQLSKHISTSITSQQYIQSTYIIAKELIENSIDANSSLIKINIDGDINVEDNGQGIKDLTNVGEGGFTSKDLTSYYIVGAVNDCSNISYGYRGQALNAIKNVCELEVISRSGEVAYKKSFKHNTITKCPRHRGTTVKVSNIFYNCPIRKKINIRNIKKDINRLCVLLDAYCYVVNAQFVLYFNKKIVFNKKGSSTLENWKNENGEPELKVENNRLLMLINQSSINRHYLFLEKRPIQNSKISNCIRATYGVYNNGSFNCVLIIKQNGDVNVSVDKSEVLLPNELEIMNLVKYEIDTFYSANYSVSRNVQKKARTSSTISSSIGNLDSSLYDFLETETKNSDKLNDCQGISAGASTNHEQTKNTALVKKENYAIDSNSSSTFTDTCHSNQISNPFINSMETHSNQASNLNVNSRELQSIRDVKEEDVKYVNNAIGLSKMTQQDSNLGICNLENSDEENNKTLAVPQSLPIDNAEEHHSLFDNAQEPKTCNNKETTELDREYQKSVDKDGLMQHAIYFTLATKNNSLSKIENQKPTKKHLLSSPVSIMEGTGSKSLKTKELTMFNASNKDGIDHEELASSFTDAYTFIKPPSKLPISLRLEKADFLRMSVVGQFNHGFIITTLKKDNKEYMIAIDQHAADEIKNFELLSANFSSRRQKLLIPVSLNVSEMDRHIINENKSIFSKNGFEVINNQLLSLPIIRDVILTINDFYNLLENIKDNIEECDKIRDIMASKACRSSVMIGDKLNPNKMKELVTDLAKLNKPWKCPHGRPTFMILRGIDC